MEASIIAGGMILASAIVMVAFLRFVESFGAYTESQRKFTGALLATHESNLLVHESSVRLCEKIQQMQRGHPRPALEVAHG